MESIKAQVLQRDEQHFICLELEVGNVHFPLSEDKPLEIKSVFNKLIVQLKKGLFEIQIDDVGTDLFSQVANEYVAQLNREIREIHGELEEYNLLKTE